MINLSKEKVNTALELENIKKHDPKLYSEIARIITNANELKLIRDGQLTDKKE